jgi:hypothetical protein
MDVDVEQTEQNDDSRDVEVAPPRARRGRKNMVIPNTESDAETSAPTRALPVRQSKSKAQEDGGTSFGFHPCTECSLVLQCG